MCGGYSSLTMAFKQLAQVLACFSEASLKFIVVMSPIIIIISIDCNYSNNTYYYYYYYSGPLIYLFIYSPANSTLAQLFSYKNGTNIHK
jgi:hypothetical protein